MKIDFCSDLHVDAWKNHVVLDYVSRKWTGEPFNSLYLYIDWQEYKHHDSRVLVIAGDIANNLMISATVVEAAAMEYEHVVVVEGNHDHYGNEMNVDDGMVFFETLLSRFPNVHYLKHNKTLTVDGVAFVGATGWYDFKAYESQGIYDNMAKRMWNLYSNDSRYPDFNGKSVESIACVQAINLADQVKTFSQDPDIQSIVVTTHMSPRADLMEWKPNDTVWNALTPSYVNTAMKQVIDADVGGKIRYWIYGHTHERKMTDINGIVYANNARGYPNESPPFALTQIEVGSK